MTQFVADYYAFAAKGYVHLGMQQAKPRPAGGTWVMFYPKSLPKNASLVHQITAGQVKVLFNGSAEVFEALQEKYKESLPQNASIDVTGKSVAISLEVPKLDPLQISFSKQQEKVAQALEALSVLEKMLSAQKAI
jgi:hypothetical protein